MRINQNFTGWDPSKLTKISRVAGKQIHSKCLGFSSVSTRSDPTSIFFLRGSPWLDELRLWDTDHGYDAAISALETSLKKMKAQPAGFFWATCVFGWIPFRSLTSPLKSHRNPIGKACLSTTIFRGKQLNFGGVVDVSMLS